VVVKLQNKGLRGLYNLPYKMSKKRPFGVILGAFSNFFKIKKIVASKNFRNKIE
jgi:hypothetical protein